MNYQQLLAFIRELKEMQSEFEFISPGIAWLYSDVRKPGCVAIGTIDKVSIEACLSVLLEGLFSTLVNPKTGQAFTVKKDSIVYVAKPHHPNELLIAHSGLFTTL